MALDDAEFLFRQLTQPSWLQYIGDRGVRSIEDAGRYIQAKTLAQYETLGYGMNLVQLKATGEPIGVCGLVKRETLPHPDLGFALLEEHWRKGYAVEAAAAVMEHARRVLGIARILAITTTTNDRSGNVLIKLGFRLENDAYLTPEGERLRLYAASPASGQTHHTGVRPMANLDKALATQLANIEKRTGKSLAELAAIVKSSGLSRHGELVAMLKTSLGMGHGDANTLVQTVLKSEGQSGAAVQGLSAAQVLDGLYAGPKAALRPIHDKLLLEIRRFGDFEEAPKKTYVSYRRKKQFAMIGPATNTRVEVGLNMKGVKATDRLQELPAGQMCNYKVRLTGLQDVDGELIAWIRTAFEAAG